jgi:PAS domain-containing protein
MELSTANDQPEIITYAAALSSIADGVIVADMDARVTFMNPILICNQKEGHG